MSYGNDMAAVDEGDPIKGLPDLTNVRRCSCCRRLHEMRTQPNATPQLTCPRKLQWCFGEHFVVTALVRECVIEIPLGCSPGMVMFIM